MDRWQGRVAVVTGASEGIGEAVVRRLAASGMKVVALARRQHLLEEIERDVNKDPKNGKVKGLVCDVSSYEEVSVTFKKIEQDMGPISVLVNNAAVLKPVPLLNIDLENVQATFDTNVMGVMNCVKAGLESMKTNNISDGHIINISSVSAHMDVDQLREFSTYAAFKSALNFLSKGLKHQLGKDKTKIRVTTVTPGLVQTAMTGALIPTFDEVPHLKPDDVAATVEYAISTPPHVNIREIIVEPA